MDRAALAVQYVFLFTLAAGIMVLLAAIQATRDERMFESAVLRTLGARRSVVLQGVAAEFTALGLLAGTLAACGAAAIGYVIATQLFELDYLPGAGFVVGGLARRRRGSRHQRHAGGALGRQPVAGRDVARRLSTPLRDRARVVSTSAGSSRVSCREHTEDSMIELFTAATPNGWKASITLEELGASVHGAQDLVRQAASRRSRGF